MAASRWRLLLAVTYLTLLIHESVAPRVRTSRRGRFGLKPHRFRPQQAKPDLDSGANTVKNNAQTTTAARWSTQAYIGNLWCF